MGRIKAQRINTDMMQGRREELAIQYYFRNLEIERKNANLPTTYIAFEAIRNMVAGRIEGYEDQDLLELYPEEWGQETLTVPAAILRSLVSRWIAYIEAPEGKSLGEAFGLEGGGQGSHRIKSKMKTLMKHRKIANAVEVEYLLANHQGQPISERKACEIVSEREQLSFAKVEAAHKKLKKQIREGMSSEGYTLTDD